MSEQHTLISKFLSLVLRHKPETIGLELNSEGWASIKDLISESNLPLTFNTIKKIVDNSDKKRFIISEDGQFIRANQGHSLPVNLGLSSRKPPQFLYHGTAKHSLKSIMLQGICPQNRQYVHLSSDVKTAKNVGQRHGKPVVLTIHALKMWHKNHLFFQAENGVWLTKFVPISFISNQTP